MSTSVIVAIIQALLAALSGILAELMKDDSHSS